MKLLRLFTYLVVGTCLDAMPFRPSNAQQPDLHAIVEPSGAVVLCILGGEILFADRCEGAGQLTIVQPIEEGPVVWRVATGTVTLENEAPTNPDCALSRAKWDPKTEQTVCTGKQIRNVEPVAVLTQLSKITSAAGAVHQLTANLTPADLTAFALDLDSDGLEEIIFVASSVKRSNDEFEKGEGLTPIRCKPV